MLKNFYDAIIIGTGIAGLYTAANITDKKVLLITKGSLEKSGNSPLAQGGIVSCIYKEQHLADTLAAGSYYNDVSTIKFIEEESQRNIGRLIELGVEFERDESGKLMYTKEGGHSTNTILYVKDITGKAIVDVLARNALNTKNIDISEHTIVTDIEMLEDQMIRVNILNDMACSVYTNNVVLATGGIGMLYENTTNSPEATGDGIALAYELGCKIKDMEFVQFHPTSIKDRDEEKRFLLSESLRGEGAILINDLGERFMKEQHEMAELAPRDIVSRAIFMEKRRGRRVYLDISHKSKDYILDRFPNIYYKCLSEGIDISKAPIEVSPAQHYLMGGIAVDLNGKTSVDGIYACGECSCTGLHGANRLASNSLLEAVVFGNKIAEEISLAEVESGNDHIENLSCCPADQKMRDYSQYRERLRSIMENRLGIIRNEDSMAEAEKEIEDLKRMTESLKSNTREYHELKNMLLVAGLITRAAINRKTSLGAHYIGGNDDK